MIILRRESGPMLAVLILQIGIQPYGLGFSSDSHVIKFAFSYLDRGSCLLEFLILY